jgi:hypothetical protein
MVRGVLLIVAVAVYGANSRDVAAQAAESTSTLAVNSTSSDELASWIDHRSTKHWRSLGVEIPAIVDDATFLRRVYLDLVGTIPSVSDVRDFLADKSESKRVRMVDRLLDDSRSSAHLSRVWRRILLSETNVPDQLAQQLETWLERELRGRASYDELVRTLVTAGGAEPNRAANTSVKQTTLVAFLQSSGGQPANIASAVSRVFLGVRLECAQCHDHPFASWKQEDLWGIAAFFAGARLERNPAGNLVDGPASAQPLADEPVSEITPSEINRTFAARYLWTNVGAAEIPSGKPPRQAFSEWLTSRDNPHFAATAVNRIWEYLCGDGLTASVNELDQATLKQRAVLLDGLAERFAASGFDLRWLMRGICCSGYYQLPATTGDHTYDAPGRPLKVVTPEQLFDSLEVSLGLPMSRIDLGARFNGQRDQLVARMAEVLGDSPDDFRAKLPQALILMNGRLTAEATDLEQSRTLRAVVDAPFLKSSDKIETLFLATLTRRPSGIESQKLEAYVNEQTSTESRNRAYAEIMWALINSPEFVLIR